jgi:hypothetical protein
MPRWLRYAVSMLLGLLVITVAFEGLSLSLLVKLDAFGLLALGLLAVGIRLGERDTKEVSDQRPRDPHSDTYIPHG